MIQFYTVIVSLAVKEQVNYFTTNMSLNFLLAPVNLQKYLFVLLTFDDKMNVTIKVVFV